MPRVVLRSGDVSAIVDTRRGGRLASLQFGGTEVLITNAKDTLEWGCYPMVPFAGRVRDARLSFDGTSHELNANAGRHSIHGTVFDVVWELENHNDTSATLVTGLGARWPFEGLVIHRIDVDPDGITMRIAVHADHTQPVQIGWHPWFVKPERCEHGCSLMHVRGVDGIATSTLVPVERGPWDDCFVSEGARPRVRVDQVDLVLSSDCSHWVVYDMPAHATCIEPQQGPPNAINDVPDVVEAGSMTARWFRIARDRLS